MNISIVERLRPFSHLPGTSTILSGCGYQVQIFPCLIRLYHLKKALPFLVAELNLELKGPIQQSTVWNNLEKGHITVSGKTMEGWMRYHLISSQRNEGIRLLIDRAPLRGFSLYQGQTHFLLQEKEWLDILGDPSSFEPYHISLHERLSLGQHKAQDWELIKRRLNLAEIFPLWHRLGQLVPSMSIPQSYKGTLSLLETCQKSFMEEKPEEAQHSWLNLIKGGLTSLLTPRLEDTDYQGLVSNSPLESLEVSPLVLLTEGAALIRRLFFQQSQNQIDILPYLLPSLHCGRLVNVPLEKGGRMSLEWTKKTIRRLILYVEQDQEVMLKFRSHVRSYRLRDHLKNQGRKKRLSLVTFF